MTGAIGSVSGGFAWLESSDENACGDAKSGCDSVGAGAGLLKKAEGDPEADPKLEDEVGSDTGAGASDAKSVAEGSAGSGVVAGEAET